VDVSFGGPPYVSQTADPATVALARGMAERMESAQA
jgi:hypothetical protein